MSNELKMPKCYFEMTNFEKNTNCSRQGPTGRSGSEPEVPVSSRAYQKMGPDLLVTTSGMLWKVSELSVLNRKIRLEFNFLPLESYFPEGPVNPILKLTASF